MAPRLPRVDDAGALDLRATEASSDLLLRAPQIPTKPSTRSTSVPAADDGSVRRPGARWLLFRLIGIAFAFLIDLLGALTLLALCAIACWYAWVHFGRLG